MSVVIGLVRRDKNPDVLEAFGGGRTVHHASARRSFVGDEVMPLPENEF